MRKKNNNKVNTSSTLLISDNFSHNQLMDSIIDKCQKDIKRYSQNFKFRSLKIKKKASLEHIRMRSLFSTQTLINKQYFQTKKKIFLQKIIKKPINFKFNNNKYLQDLFLLGKQIETKFNFITAEKSAKSKVKLIKEKVQTLQNNKKKQINANFILNQLYYLGIAIEHKNIARVQKILYYLIDQTKDQIIINIGVLYVTQFFQQISNKQMNALYLIRNIFRKLIHYKIPYFLILGLRMFVSFGNQTRYYERTQKYDALLSVLKKIMKLSWKQNMKELELQVYMDLSIVYYKKQEIELSQFFKLKFEKGIFQTDPITKNSAIQQINKEISHYEDHGQLNIENDSFNMEMLKSQYLRQNKIESLEQEISVNNKNYMSEQLINQKKNIYGPIKTSFKGQIYQLITTSDIKKYGYIFKNMTNKKVRSPIIITQCSPIKNLECYFREVKKDEIQQRKMISVQNFNGGWALLYQLYKQLIKITITEEEILV